MWKEPLNRKPLHLFQELSKAQEAKKRPGKKADRQEYKALAFVDLGASERNNGASKNETPFNFRKSLESRPLNRNATIRNIPTPSRNRDSSTSMQKPNLQSKSSAEFDTDKYLRAVTVKEIQDRVKKVVSDFEDKPYTARRLSKDDLFNQIHENLNCIQDDMLRINVINLMSRYEKMSLQMGKPESISSLPSEIIERDELLQSVKNWMETGTSVKDIIEREEQMKDEEEDIVSDSVLLEECKDNMQSKIEKIVDLKQKVQQYKDKGLDFRQLDRESKDLNEEIMEDFDANMKRQNKKKAKAVSDKKKREFTYLKNAATEIYELLRRTRMNSEEERKIFNEKMTGILMIVEARETHIDFLENKLENQTRNQAKLTSDMLKQKKELTQAKDNIQKEINEKKILERNVERLEKVTAALQRKGESGLFKDVDTRVQILKQQNDILTYNVKERNATIDDQARQIQMLKRSLRKASDGSVRSGASIISRRSGTEMLPSVRSSSFSNTVLKAEVELLRKRIDELEGDNSKLKAQLKLLNPEDKDALINFEHQMTQTKMKPLPDQLRNVAVQVAALANPFPESILIPQFGKRKVSDAYNLQNNLIPNMENYEEWGAENQVKLPTKLEDIQDSQQLMRINPNMFLRRLSNITGIVTSNYQLNPSLNDDRVLQSRESGIKLMKQLNKEVILDAKAFLENQQEEKQVKEDAAMPAFEMSVASYEENQPQLNLSALSPSSSQTNVSMEEHLALEKSPSKIDEEDSQKARLRDPKISIPSSNTPHTLDVEDLQNAMFANMETRTGDSKTSSLSSMRRFSRNMKELAVDMLAGKDPMDINSASDGVQKIITEAATIAGTIGNYVERVQGYIGCRADIMKQANDAIKQNLPDEVLEAIGTERRPSDSKSEIELLKNSSEPYTKQVEEKIKLVEEAVKEMVEESMNLFITEVGKQHEDYAKIRTAVEEHQVLRNSTNTPLDKMQMSKKLKAKVDQVAKDFDRFRSAPKHERKRHTHEVTDPFAVTETSHNKDPNYYMSRDESKRQSAAAPPSVLTGAQVMASMIQQHRFRQSDPKQLAVQGMHTTGTPFNFSNRNQYELQQKNFMKQQRMSRGLDLSPNVMRASVHTASHSPPGTRDGKEPHLMNNFSFPLGARKQEARKEKVHPDKRSFTTSQFRQQLGFNKNFALKLIKPHALPDGLSFSKPYPTSKELNSNLMKKQTEKKYDQVRPGLFKLPLLPGPQKD